MELRVKSEGNSKRSLCLCFALCYTPLTSAQGILAKASEEENHHIF